MARPLSTLLPMDGEDAKLVGRIATEAGPTAILIHDGEVFDVSKVWPTSASYLSDPGVADRDRLGRVEDLRAQAAWSEGSGLTLLSPLDLQCVIEERGTMFAPIEDRDAPGCGFTDKVGDRVRVSSPRLGVLENEVTTCDAAPPWTMGLIALMANLSARGLLKA